MSLRKTGKNLLYVNMILSNYTKEHLESKVEAEYNVNNIIKLYGKLRRVANAG